MNTSGPFVDTFGKPLLRHAITGFIDVLGFSQLSTSVGTAEESQHVLSRVAAAIRKSRVAVAERFAAEPLADPNRWALKFFSDNLVVAFPTELDDYSAQDVARFAIRCVQQYQLQMALHGFFVRGAMTIGAICLTDEIIFGPSLVESYVLESKTSIVPRVILTKPLQELLIGPPESVTPETAVSICQDIDGWWFFNYLQAARGRSGIDWTLIKRHKESVLESLKQTTRHDVLPKYGWSCRYHNVFCHWHEHELGYSDDYRIQRTDEQSTIYRWRDLLDTST